MRLMGEVAVVTGSTRHIGAAIAQKLGVEGAKVVVTGRSEDFGNAVIGSLREKGGDGIFIKTDVTRESDIRHAIKSAVDKFGKLTILVNNAAPTELTVGPNAIDGMIKDITTAHWEQLFTAFLTSAFWGCKHAIPEIAKAGGGAIINISSVGAVRAVAGTSAYAASKAAMHALTRSVAIENAGDHIRCNCVLPGMTPNLSGDAKVDARAMVDNPQYGRAMREFQPWPRWGTAEDVANVVAFLASKEAEFVNGVVMPVDGGAMCRMPLPRMTTEYWDEDKS